VRGETGVDTLRLVFEVERQPEGFLGDLGGWRVDGYPALGLVAVEGHPLEGGLGSPDDVVRSGTAVREMVDEAFGVRRDRGVSRLDVTTTRGFRDPASGRAFLAGVAAVELPRCDAVRRGTPPHSVAWVHARGRRILARTYDKSREQGGAPWESIRLEDQGRFSSSSGRPPLEVAAEAGFQRRRLVQRFGPMAKSVQGVKAMTLPRLLQGLADEVVYGYRSASEARKLAGAVALFAGGVQPGRGDATLYRWRRELREAGLQPVGSWADEAVEVDLGAELDAALEELSA